MLEYPQEGIKVSIIISRRFKKRKGFSVIGNREWKGHRSLLLLRVTSRWCCRPRHGKPMPGSVCSWIFSFSKLFSVSLQMCSFKWSIKFYNHYLKNRKIIVICASRARIFLSVQTFSVSQMSAFVLASCPSPQHPVSATDTWIVDGTHRVSLDTV